ncbi:molybdopterin-dependent oxidoreductase [Chelatococcus reniformis]|uniref:Dimethylsulfoxide reductase n=1 Tax=Chelatococcus reniformis TaxID=1494448 RepID=A0A916XPD5_9HYPH|nr:molybdopterin-dependent oxidoreductase [Chelatococcus reniformis]GGC89242.1 dimethylsulfoxide reductase [Chelatococcus reniformis]
MDGQGAAGARYTAFHWGTYRTRLDADGAIGLEPFDGDPSPSPIGLDLAASLAAPCRVGRPHVRAGWLDGHAAGAFGGAGRGREPFVPVSWEVALDLVAAELARVRADHGNAAIFGGSYGWGSAGRFHHPQGQLHRFLNLIGGYTRSVNAYSHAAAEVILPYVIGHGLRPFHGTQMPWPVLAEHAELVVAFGGMNAKNAQVSPGGVGSHIVRRSLARCAERGVRFVNVSPIRDDMPALVAPEWLPLRPNTDVAVMLALAFVLIEEGLCDHDFLARCTVGFDVFRRYVGGETDGVAKTPEWAAGIADVPAAALRDLARRMARARTFIALSWSIQRGDHGEQPIWAGIALAAVLGQIGLPGGGFGIGHGCCNYIGNPAARVPWAALPQGRNAVDAFVPVARFTDMLLTPGASFDYDGKRLSYPDVKLVYWAGGNPFHHQQDINRLLAGWRRPQTIIVNEVWWNACARHADIVLPVTSPLERNDFGAAAGEGAAVAMRQAMQPVGEARNDFDIFRGLAARLGVLEAFAEGRDEMAWVRHLYEQSRAAAQRMGIALPAFDAFWEQGVVELPEGAAGPLLFEAFRGEPEAHPLPTPSGRIEISSATIGAFGYDDCPHHPAWIEPAERLGGPSTGSYPLHLISSQPAVRLHSQHDHASLSRAAKIAGREPITLHPADAAARCIEAGDIVRVFNGRGECLAGAVVSEALRPGVVQLATGAWYDPQAGSEGAPRDVHGNPNMLTMDKGTSRLAQGPTAMTTLVEVERFRGNAPEIRVFAAPEGVD